MLAGVLLAGCARTPVAPPKPPPPPDAPRDVIHYKVDYDGGSKAWGYEVRLLSDQSVTYIGTGGVKTVGVRKFSISPEQYVSLTRAFEYAHFMQMRAPRTGARNTPFSLTYTSEGKSHTLSGFDPAPGWPRSLYQLVWSLENVLQANALACPINLTINKEELNACATRAKLMEQHYLGKK